MERTRRAQYVKAVAAAHLEIAQHDVEVPFVQTLDRLVPVGSFFDLQLTRNPGGAFGILPSSPVLFFLATVFIVGGVLAWGLTSGAAPVPLGLVAGGGLGNLVDRVVRDPGGMQGRVVDFIHFHFWPTFNLADSAIVVGAALLILVELRPRHR